MDPIDKLRSRIQKRGTSSMGRVFKIIDNDRSWTLNLEEFSRAVKDFGVQDITTEEINELFKKFDKDGGGSVDYNEFLETLKPAMSEKRKALVNQAFDKTDKTGDGVYSIEDIKGRSKAWKNSHGHKVMEEMLSVFDSNKDGKVTRAEFMQYFSGISASIDNDEHFEMMMKSSYLM